MNIDRREVKIGFVRISNFSPGDLVENMVGDVYVVGDRYNDVYGVQLDNGSNVTHHDLLVRKVEGKISISNG